MLSDKSQILDTQKNQSHFLFFYELFVDSRNIHQKWKS